MTGSRMRPRRRGLYLTVNGFTAGPDTLIGAMLRAAGMRDAASAPGFAPAPLEKLVLHPPDAMILGFFDPASAATQHWSLASHPALKATLRGRNRGRSPRPSCRRRAAWRR